MTDRYDVVIVGGGNAALCAALAAAEQGSQSRPAGTRLGGEARRQLEIHRRRLSHGSSRRAGHQARGAGPERSRYRAYRLRPIYRRRLSRRSRAHNAVLHRPGPRRDAREEQHGHGALADGPRGEVSAELRATGLQPRRTVQVFRGRGDLRQWRRSRSRRVGIQGSFRARRHDPVQCARHVADPRQERHRRHPRDHRWR